MDKKFNRMGSSLSSFFTAASAFGFPQGFVCNGNSMFHVNKGVVGVRSDGAKNTVLQRLKVSNVVNFGSIGSTVCNSPALGYTGHPKDIYPGGIYGGA